ncbi:SUN domain-containing protein 1-like [Tigriopus californicus]|uniref:SUN domain-containing protein 1-like n=1 Tax=Tigriopus californicus TaxID=6832 RepID=UPI0027DA7BF5|nr:SUN domain-containing protein 1-like [Tigriopus californicus]
MADLTDSLQRAWLADLTQHSSSTLRQTAREVIEETDLGAQIRESVRAEYEKLSLNGTVPNEGSPPDQVQTLVDHALRIYDADKTGRFDYAQESIGGSVLTTRCTETYDSVSAVYSVFGIPIWWEKNTPRTILQPGANPGQCWAFKGSLGSVVIQLSERITVHAVTLEHMPKMVSPTNSIESAPKQFEIFGLTDVHDESPLSLGNFTYMDDGNSLQTFPIHQHQDREFNIVEMKILSNHGHMLYTCIYRLRVHGSTTISKPQEH